MRFSAPSSCAWNGPMEQPRRCCQPQGVNNSWVPPVTRPDRKFSSSVSAVTCTKFHTGTGPGVTPHHSGIDRPVPSETVRRLGIDEFSFPLSLRLTQPRSTPSPDTFWNSRRSPSSCNSCDEKRNVQRKKNRGRLKIIKRSGGTWGFVHLITTFS